MRTLEENVDRVKTARDKLRNALVGKGLSEEDVNSLNSLVDIVAGVDAIFPIGFGEEMYYMRDMFAHCDSISSLTFHEGFGLNVKFAESMFYDCYSLISLTLPKGFGANITGAVSMFEFCVSLPSLNFPNGFGANIKSSNGMFASCYSLNSLIFPNGFGLSITEATYMFGECNSLTSLTFPSGFGSSINDADSMFSYCSALTDINGDLALKVSFALSDCTKLTHQSLMNVLNSIQNVSVTKTLTLGSTNLAKLTDEEKAIATEKGWTLA